MNSDTTTLLHDATVEVVERVKRDLSGEHDSDRCDCEQCAWANEQERRQAQREPQTVSDDRRLLWADAATVRAAVADVLDTYPPAVTKHLSWQFNPQDESDAETEIRGVFIDAVLARVAQLQQPPHSYPRLEVLCDSHKRRRLPTYSGECVDCRRERS